MKILRYVVVNAAAASSDDRWKGSSPAAPVAIGNALFEWMGYDDEAQPITTTLPTMSSRERPRCPGSR